MHPLRILITNVTLASHTGTELYVLDLARRLLRLGHQPVVYTPEPGPIAARIRLATVPVVDDLAALGTWAPDVVHGHHTLETILALLHFPSAPAIYVCHDSTVWFDEAPPLARIVLHVAVDETCRDRLELVHGVPGEQIRILPNWVDLGRFRPRPPLPGQPERAVVFSNYARAGSHLDVVREACERLGVPLDVIGHGAGTATAQPEDLLPAYDLVFAKAKCALEAMAVGAAVVLCDFRGLGPMVTSAEFDRLRRLNFGARALQSPLDPDAVAIQIKRYDREDAAAVTARVRAEAGLEAAVDQLIEVYRDAIAAGSKLAPDPVGEGRALATFLRPVSLDLRRAEGAAGRLAELEAQRDAWQAERHDLSTSRERLAHELDQTRAELGRAGAELGRAGAELDQAHAELEHAQQRLAAEGARGAELEDLRAEAASYQRELEGLRRLAHGRAEAADALQRELQAVSATLTFRLRARVLRLPVAGRLLRLALRLLRP